MAGPAHLTPKDVLAVVDARRIENASVAEWRAKEDEAQGKGSHSINFDRWEASRTDARLQVVSKCLDKLSTEALKELQTLLYAGSDGGWRAWPEDEWDKRPWMRWPQAVEAFKSINDMDRERMIHSFGEMARLEQDLYFGIEGMGLDLGWTTILQWMSRPNTPDEFDEQSERVEEGY